MGGTFGNLRVGSSQGASSQRRSFARVVRHFADNRAEAFTVILGLAAAMAPASSNEVSLAFVTMPACVGLDTE